VGHHQGKGTKKSSGEVTELQKLLISKRRPGENRLKMEAKKMSTDEKEVGEIIRLQIGVI
jgi:hypothetical protein